MAVSIPITFSRSKDSGQALSYVVGYVKARLAEFAAR